MAKAEHDELDRFSEIEFLLNPRAGVDFLTEEIMDRINDQEMREDIQFDDILAENAFQVYEKRRRQAHSGGIWIKKNKHGAISYKVAITMIDGIEIVEEKPL